MLINLVNLGLTLIVSAEAHLTSEPIILSLVFPETRSTLKSNAAVAVF